MNLVNQLLELLVFALLPMFLGVQVQLSELRLLTGHYNYRIQLPQGVTYVSLCLSLALVGYQLWSYCAFLHMLPAEFIDPFHIVGHEVLMLMLGVGIFAVAEWILPRLHPSKAFNAWSFRFFLGIMLYAAFLHASLFSLTYFCIGLYLRNNPFGICYGKNLWIANRMKRSQQVNFDDMHYADGTEFPRPDVSFAGCKHHADESALPRINVSERGITPNDVDCTNAVQALIDEVGEGGGGVIFFPAGRYLFNTAGDEYLQINHSHIIIEGEVDAQGRPLATLVNCGKTSRGHKNPWVSPFFITTGEVLQPSNEFWGLQFRKRKSLIMESNSLADPGGDGSILSPELTTRITAPAVKGDTLLHVADAQKVGKYVLVALYNTDARGELIHDILGVDELRPEWTVACRAGEEEAPSYQWLVEVRRVVDDETIELVRPLLRDIDLKFDPVVCNVALLEDIVIRNLALDSTWNGQFRHHGFPLYYNITRTQEMDYGWNAICMKRCAHSLVDNVVIRNFSNPLYVLDSRNVTVRRTDIGGFDGHQALKAYMHTCDCLFEDIVFRSHFADMMGGEGPAYANVFRRISYLNPVFHPVDYDFHGFASEPMSPPSDNMFTQICGFRFFKSAGSLSHQPSCARRNVWWNVCSEGEHKGDYLFYAMSYREKKGLLRIVYACGYAAAMAQKGRNLSPRAFVKNVKWKLSNIDEVGFERSEHRKLFFTDNHVYGIQTLGRLFTLIATLLALAVPTLGTAQTLLWDVTDIDAKSVTPSADRFCEMAPVAVTDKPLSRSGNKHNFEALSIYLWPDPDNPEGPYITRDGQPNPEYKEYDLPRLEELVKRTGALSRAFYATGDAKYYDAFCRQIDAWFLDRKTRMVPDFEYNQFIPGRNNGKGCSAGIIDAYHFVNVLEAVRLVDSKKGLGKRRTRRLKRWFRDFAEWMMTSDMGQQESRATNNHGSTYDITLFVLCQFVGKEDVCSAIVSHFSERRINPQIEEDGRQPEELKRTKAFNYSVYNLQHMVDFCVILNNLGYDYINNEGQRIKKAIDYLDQFVGHREDFPYQEIGDWEQQERTVRALKAKCDGMKE